MEALIAAVAFCIFLVLVIKPIRTLVLNALDNYALQAVRELKEANKMFKEAEKLHKDIVKQHIQAKEDAKKIIAKAKSEAESIVKSAKSELKKVTEKKLQLTMSRIDQQERQIVEDLKNEAITIAMTKVQEALIHELDSEAQLTFIKNGIREVKKLVH
jgi:DNA mismatch repair protein MutS2